MFAKLRQKFLQEDTDTISRIRRELNCVVLQEQENELTDFLGKMEANYACMKDLGAEIMDRDKGLHLQLKCILHLGNWQSTTQQEHPILNLTNCALTYCWVNGITKLLTCMSLIKQPNTPLWKYIMESLAQELVEITTRNASNERR